MMKLSLIVGPKPVSGNEQCRTNIYFELGRLWADSHKMPEIQNKRAPVSSVLEAAAHLRTQSHVKCLIASQRSVGYPTAAVSQAMQEPFL